MAHPPAWHSRSSKIWSHLLFLDFSLTAPPPRLHQSGLTPGSRADATPTRTGAPEHSAPAPVLGAPLQVGVPHHSLHASTEAPPVSSHHSQHQPGAREINTRIRRVNLRESGLSKDVHQRQLHKKERQDPGGPGGSFKNAQKERITILCTRN